MGSAFAIFHNQGQACIAGSRLLLHEKIADEFLEKFLKLAKSIRVGNPLDPQTEMGPLTSVGHRERVLSYIQVAKEQGSKVLTGGKIPGEPELSGRLLRGAYGGHREAQGSRLPGRGFRPFRFRDAIQGRGRGVAKSPIPPTTAWAEDCGRATCSERIARPPRFAPGWFG